MEKRIDGETPFQAFGKEIAIEPTSSGYQIAYSTNGVDFTLDADAIVPANENLLYIGSVPGVYYKCVGLTDNDVLIRL